MPIMSVIHIAVSTITLGSTFDEAVVPELSGHKAVTQDWVGNQLQALRTKLAVFTDGLDVFGLT
jgi:hypothetical protein